MGTGRDRSECHRAGAAEELAKTRGLGCKLGLLTCCQLAECLYSDHNRAPVAPLMPQSADEAVNQHHRLRTRLPGPVQAAFGRDTAEQR